MSYPDFLDYWIDNYARINLKYSTIVSYINIIKNHVKPRIGHYRLSKTDSKLLQEMMNNIYVECSIFQKLYCKHLKSNKRFV